MMPAVNVIWTDDEIDRLIELWKCCRGLYDDTCDEYKIKGYKQVAHNRIAATFPGKKGRDVNIRLRSLRSTFTRETKTPTSTNKSGSSCKPKTDKMTLLLRKLDFLAPFSKHTSTVSSNISEERTRSATVNEHDGVESTNDEELSEDEEDEDLNEMDHQSGHDDTIHHNYQDTNDENNVTQDQSIHFNQQQRSILHQQNDRRLAQMNNSSTINGMQYINSDQGPHGTKPLVAFNYQRASSGQLQLKSNARPHIPFTVSAPHGDDINLAQMVHSKQHLDKVNFNNTELSTRSQHSSAMYNMCSPADVHLRNAYPVAQEDMYSSSIHKGHGNSAMQYNSNTPSVAADSNMLQSYDTSTMEVIGTLGSYMSTKEIDANNVAENSHVQKVTQRGTPTAAANLAQFLSHPVNKNNTVFDENDPRFQTTKGDCVPVDNSMNIKRSTVTKARKQNKSKPASATVSINPKIKTISGKTTTSSSTLVAKSKIKKATVLMQASHAQSMTKRQSAAAKQVSTTSLQMEHHDDSSDSDTCQVVYDNMDKIKNTMNGTAANLPWPTEDNPTYYAPKPKSVKKKDFRATKPRQVESSFMVQDTTSQFASIQHHTDMEDRSFHLIERRMDFMDKLYRQTEELEDERALWGRMMVKMVNRIPDECKRDDFCADLAQQASEAIHNRWKPLHPTSLPCSTSTTTTTNSISTPICSRRVLPSMTTAAPPKTQQGFQGIPCTPRRPMPYMSQAMPSFDPYNGPMGSSQRPHHPLQQSFPQDSNVAIPDNNLQYYCPSYTSL